MNPRKIPGVSKRVVALVLIAVTCFANLSAGAQQAIPIKELASVDTSVNINCGYWLWMSDKKMLATRCPSAKGELPSVVEIDIKSGSELTISTNSYISAVDERAGIARISQRDASTAWQIVGDFQVDPRSGAVIKLAGLSLLPKSRVQISAAAPDAPQVKALGSIDDGYLVAVPFASAPAASGNDAIRDRKTRWVVHGRTDIDLDVPYEEISAPVYIKYLDKYLLNGSDSRGNSATNAGLNKSWNRPYLLAPLRLMDAQGTITTVDYPQILARYGITRDVSRFGEGASFGLWMPTVAGLIVEVPRDSNSSLYLIQNSFLYRIAGASTMSVPDFPMIPADGIQEIRPSPSGCAIAFDHRRKYSGSPFLDSARYLAIIQLCPDQH